MQVRLRLSVFFVFVSTLLLSGHAFSATVTRGPYLQMGTDNAMTFRWRRDTNTDSVVRYGLSPKNLDQAVTLVNNSTEHEVRVTGLPALTEY